MIPPDLDVDDTRILQAVCGGVAAEEDPFGTIASELGMEPSALIERLAELAERGILRRIGAFLNYGELGLPASALVAWQVPSEHVDAVGEEIARRTEVTHCVRRTPSRQLPGNLYAMLHARDDERLGRLVDEMSHVAGAAPSQVLRTVERVALRPPPVGRAQGGRT